MLETPSGVRIEYGDNLYAAAIVDRNGNTLRFFYDDFLLTKIVDPVGREFLFGYDELNRLSALQDVVGNRRVRFFYSDNFDLEEVDLVFAPDLLRSGAVQALVEDGADQARHTTYDVDGLGRITRMVDARGGQTDVEWTAFDLPRAARLSRASG